MPTPCAINNLTWNVKVVWASSSLLGIGMAASTHPVYGNQVYIVAQYRDGESFC